MFTAKKLFKAQFLAIRAEVRAMSDQTLIGYDSEYYDFSLPAHYYRYIRKEVARRFPCHVLPVIPFETQPVIEYDDEEPLGDILARALAD